MKVHERNFKKIHKWCTKATHSSSKWCAFILEQSLISICNESDFRRKSLNHLQKWSQSPIWNQIWTTYHHYNKPHNSHHLFHVGHVSWPTWKGLWLTMFRIRWRGQLNELESRWSRTDVILTQLPHQSRTDEVTIILFLAIKLPRPSRWSI